MPTYNPSQLHEMVQNLLADNENNDIKASDARAMLDAIIDSFYNLVTTPNPTAPTLANVLLQGNESGPKDLLMSTGRYLVFRDQFNNMVHLRPLQPAGPVLSPVMVSLPLKAGTLALLEDIGRSSWLQPVSGVANAPAGGEPNDTRMLVGDAPTGAFLGHAGEIAVMNSGTWQFQAPQEGDMVRCLTDPAGVVRTRINGAWVLPPSIDALDLGSVLALGNATGGTDIEVEYGDGVAFRNNGHLMRLIGQDIAEDHTVTMPEASGTLATSQQVMALLAMLDLRAVLINGSATNGRSITISENDGVNYEAGANRVRVKAPAALTDNRNIQWPDKSGTVATTDDVAAVAALVDGTMRAPEAYTPAGGLYPDTYGGGTIQKGDTFRCGNGTMGSVSVNAEDLLIALVDSPGQVNGNWQVLESNRVVATQAEVENSASTDLGKLIPPQRWWQAWTKGLSLPAFGNAVRGMVLTGYAVGTNAAIAAADTMMGALAKLQGQMNAVKTDVNGRMSKAANLSDVANMAAARANLGLGQLAGLQASDAVVVPIVPGTESSDLYSDLSTDSEKAFLRPVDWDEGTGKWKYATDRVLGLVLCPIGLDPWYLDSVSVLLKGRWLTRVAAQLKTLPVPPYNEVHTYYADATALWPGTPNKRGFTATPNGKPIISVPDEESIVFDPGGLQSASGTAGGSGMVQIDGGVSTDKPAGDGGVSVFGSLLDGMKLEPGCYQVDVLLRLSQTDKLHTGTPAPLSISIAPYPDAVSSVAYGQLSIVQDVGEVFAKTFVSDPRLEASEWTTLAEVPDTQKFSVLASGIINILSTTPQQAWRVRVASATADHDLSVGGMSYIVWHRIKGLA